MFVEVRISNANFALLDMPLNNSLQEEFKELETLSYFGQYEK